eukprot:CAMPEP_0115702982 /NCGR_PEP_ID=MMETSP0272-20121206/68842_1 /TAXON_ID=71861 /ORGANISM="Scrippsiella trochoidea, Strain CCMP3099" /LENGTH=66 /DNA_ID=CAMNT_0003143789 /DNA_START=40 /DNA_END=237 /DNA_ORIENTATION=+
MAAGGSAASSCGTSRRMKLGAAELRGGGANLVIVMPVLMKRAMPTFAATRVRHPSMESAALVSEAM